MASSNQQVAQLEQARRIVLADPAHYPEIVRGVSNIIGSRATIELQRWGAEFLAEAFSSPVASGTVKESICAEVIPILKDWLENTPDEPVVKNAIQTCASIYPYVFRHVTHNPTAFVLWDEVSAIKSNVYKRWDSAPIGVRICCIKFVQRIVQVQTPGIISDPRRPEQNEISLAIVPRDHPIVALPRLEAEASGLLDRLLSVLGDDSSTAHTIDATINCMAVLVRTRPAVANKIVSAILSFNPFKNVHPPLSTKDRVKVRSIERTVRAFLLHVGRRGDQSQFYARIKQYVERNMALRVEMEGGVSKKRGPPEPTDGLDDAKRQKLGAQLEPPPVFAPLPPGPVTLAQVFTLTKDPTASFDGKALPIHLVHQINIAVLMGTSSQRFNDAVNSVRSRLLELENRARASQPSGAGPGAVEDDEEYEPEFEPAEDLEQVTNNLDSAPTPDQEEAEDVPAVALSAFKLPQPPPVSRDEAQLLAKESIGRVFSMIEAVEQPGKVPKAGIHRLAGTQFDNDAWITLITRLATRAPSNLENLADEPAASVPSSESGLKDGDLITRGSLGDGIRETLFQYVITDFRHRLNIAIAWLNEEWYNERVLEKQSKSNGNGAIQFHEGNGSTASFSTYEYWTLRVLDSISPYLDAKDKSLIRFLSEIPQLSGPVLSRVKHIANDPDRASLAVNALHYLVLTRLPVRELALDALEDLWKNYEGAEVYAKKPLVKYRPGVLEQVKGGQNGSGNGNRVGVKDEEMGEITTPVNGSGGGGLGGSTSGQTQPLEQGKLGPVAFAGSSGANIDGSPPAIATAM